MVLEVLVGVFIFVGPPGCPPGAHVKYICCIMFKIRGLLSYAYIILYIDNFIIRS